MDSETMERILPESLSVGSDLERKILQVHLERYNFAAVNLKPDQILDIACGVGYGTHLLSERFPGQLSLTGVDLSKGAVQYAQTTYAKDGLTFYCADAYSFLEEADGTYDTIISLETIEHLPDVQRFANGLLRALKRKGRLIVSAPVTPSVDINPHHLTDFTCRSLRELFVSLGLRELGSLSQVHWFNPLKLLGSSDKRMDQMRKGMIKYYLSNPSSFLLRVYATVRFGFSNRYLTLVLEKP